MFYCISSRVENSGQLYGCFKIGPFSEHQSLTFANALRRTLLTHYSIYLAVHIYGIEHEFSTLSGIRESVLDIMANLEKICFQTTQPLTKPKVAFLNFYGPGIIQAKHLHLPSGIKCVQPSHYIATAEVDGQLMFKLFFSSVQLKNLLIFQHPIVDKVNYTLKSEFIFFEVWTNGSLHPQKAILNGMNKLLLEMARFQRAIFLQDKISPFNEKLLNLEISKFEFRNLSLFEKKTKFDFLN